MSDTFLDGVVQTSDPIIVNHATISYDAPNPVTVSFNPWGDENGETFSSVDLIGGETLQIPLILRANKDVKLLIVNLGSTLKDNFDAELVSDRADYIEGLSFGNDIKYIQNNYSNPNSIVYAHVEKDTFVNALRNTFLNKMSTLKTMIAEYDALINDTNTYDTYDYTVRVQQLISVNNYYIYHFIADILSVHLKNFSSVGDTSSILHSYLRKKFDLIESPEVPANTPSSIQVDAVYDLIGSYASATGMIGYIKNLIDTTNTNVSETYTYEHMMEISVELKKILEVVPFFAYVSEKMVYLINDVTQLSNYLTNQMNLVSNAAEIALQKISLAFNETPFEIGYHVIDQNRVYENSLKNVIRLQPKVGSRRYTMKNSATYPNSNVNPVNYVTATRVTTQSMDIGNFSFEQDENNQLVIKKNGEQIFVVESFYKQN